MQIRKTRQSDIPRIIEIENKCFADPWSAETFCEVLASDLSYCLTGVTDSGVCAYIIMLLRGDCAHLADIAVVSGCRRNGYARQIFNAAVEELNGRGIRDYTLEVRVSNETAISAYLSFGFAAAGIRPRYYDDGEDALIMWLRPHP